METGRERCRIGAVVKALGGIGCFALLIFALTPFGLAYVYLRYSGAVAEGQVVAKSEYIRMPGADAFERVFEVEYRFRPADSARVETASEQVGQALYDSLRPGGPVEVRYAPATLRSLHVQYVGSILANNSWRSRLPSASDDKRNALEVCAIALMFVVGWLAYRTKSQALGLIAVFWAAAVCSSIVPFGGFAAVVVFLTARKRSAAGFGFVVAAGLVVGMGVLYLRLPRPDPPIAGPSKQGVAVVRDFREVDHIWPIRRRSSGQYLRKPFEMLDLDVAGVHAVDRVDVGSIPNLAKGAVVPVVYPVGYPRAAQVQGASRAYARDAFRYLVEIQYGVGIPLGFVLFFLIALPGKLFQWFVRRATTAVR